MRWPSVVFMMSGIAAAGVSFSHVDKRVRQDPTPQSLLAARCGSCHGGDSPAGGLDLTKSLNVIAEDWVIAKGDPEHSFLVRRILGKGGRQMPPNGPALTEAETAVFSNWIKSLKPNPSPIFQVRCASCHSGQGAAGRLDLTKSLSELATSPDVVPGDPESSALLKRITGKASPQMPPGGRTPLNDTDTKVVSDWISSLTDPTPVFNGKCMPCHAGQRAAAGFNLARPLKELAKSPQVVPGDPDNSAIIKRITGKVMPLMPPGGHALSDADIALVTAWVKSLKS